jgi:high-affinity Fe2+/Pb2+ permease
MAFQDYFSLVAFFIFLRETLEAAVIIAVLLQCMNRTAPRLKRQGEGSCHNSCHSKRHCHQSVLAGFLTTAATLCVARRLRSS